MPNKAMKIIANIYEPVRATGVFLKSKMRLIF